MSVSIMITCILSKLEKAKMFTPLMKKCFTTQRLMLILGPKPKSIPEHSSVVEQRYFSSHTVVRTHLFRSGSNTLLYDFLPSKGIPAAAEMPFSMQVSESDTFFIERKKVSLIAKGKYEKWLTPEGLLKLEGWAREGLTDEQIAEKMGIRRETLYAWSKKYPNISNTLKRGKEVVDLQVENALLKRALGYEYEEVAEEYESGTLTKKKVTKKRVIPDTTA